MSEFVIEVLSQDDAQCELEVFVPDDLRYLEGHFEGNPIVPGVAQLLPLVWDGAKRVWPDLPPPKEVRRLKFLDALRPGQQLRIALTRADGKVKFEIRRGDTLCTRGTFVA